MLPRFGFHMNVNAMVKTGARDPISEKTIIDEDAARPFPLKEGENGEQGGVGVPHASLVRLAKHRVYLVLFRVVQPRGWAIRHETVHINLGGFAAIPVFAVVRLNKFGPNAEGLSHDRLCITKTPSHALALSPVLGTLPRAPPRRPRSRV